jgi:hypothetical protein
MTQENGSFGLEISSHREKPFPGDFAKEERGEFYRLRDVDFMTANS